MHVNIKIMGCDRNPQMTNLIDDPKTRSKMWNSNDNQIYLTNDRFNIWSQYQIQINKLFYIQCMLQ
jgi:hypothetical protein